MISDKKQLFSFASIFAMGLIAVPVPGAIAQDQVWLQQYGSGAGEQANAIVSDGAGGTFVAAHTRGGFASPNAGNFDALLVHYDSSGAQLWATQIGTSEYEGASAVAVDGAGGVFVTGYTAGNLGGPNSGPLDAFIARYSSTGSLLWIKQFGTSENDAVEDALSDGAGGVIVSGHTSGSLFGTHLGETDVFLARYDGAGILLWQTQFGSSGRDNPSGLAADGTGGVFATGSTYGDMVGTNAGGGDCYIAHYDGSGNQLWIRQVGTSANEGFSATATDGRGGAWAIGAGPSTFGTDYDVLITRFDESGDREQTIQFGSSTNDDPRGVAPDGAGGLIVTGVTEGNLAGPSAGGYDTFIAHFGASGGQKWVRQFGSSEGDFSGDVTIDDAGRAVVVGTTVGSLGGPFSGEADIFLACYSLPGQACYADCDQSTGAGVLDIFDFLCFQDAFVKGCP